MEHDTSSNIADSHNSHEQPESQLAIHASRYSDFYKSHDGGKYEKSGTAYYTITKYSTQDNLRKRT